MTQREFPPFHVRSRVIALLIVAAVMVPAWPAAAQNWTFDARKIAMGAAGGADHPASRMIDEEQRYTSIVLPFGLLFQVLPNRDVFNPDSDEFDIVRAVEFAAAPIHYVMGRDDASTSTSGRQLSLDIRNATLSRDLNVYRGFVPSQQPVAEGLSHTTWGGTIPLSRGAGGSMQGIYVGGGPYLSMRTAASIDQQLIDVLGSQTSVYLPNSSFGVDVTARTQMAAAIAVGYRGRFGLAQATSERDGVYIAVDYNYLYGFLFEDIDTNVDLATDATGLLTIDPINTVTPLFIGRNSSDSGRGYAVDAGVGIVSGGIELGFGVKGLVNQIEWSEVERTTYALGSLFTGDTDFIEAGPVPMADITNELPRDYSGYVGLRQGASYVVTEFTRGFQGTSFRAGVEQGAGMLDLRVGALYSRERWNPTGGIGINMGPRVSIDLAVFGSSANVARERRLTLAASLRINAGQ